MKGILSILSGIRIIKASFVPKDSIVVGEKMFERFKLAFPEAQQDNVVNLQTTTVSCDVCDSSCLKGSMYVCGECATKESGTQPMDVQQIKYEIRSLLANYESYVVLHGAPKSEGWFFNRLRELSAYQPFSKCWPK